MRKLAIVYQNLRTGGEPRQVINLARHLDKKRWSVAIVLLERTGVWLPEIPHDVRLFSLDERFPRTWALWFWTVAKALKLRRLLLRESVDVVMAFGGFPTNALCALAALGSKGPKLVWVMQAEAERAFAFRRFRHVKRYLLRALLQNRTASYVAVSAGIKRKLRESLSLSDEDVEVVHNSVDEEELTRKANEPTAWPKIPGKLRMLSIAKLRPEKGLSDLISALASLAQQFDFEMFVLGEGMERERLQRYIGERNLDSRVHLLGEVSNPFAWLKTGDIFVLPSRMETFGTAIVEAMFFGLPIVATSTDGANETIVHGEDGILVPIGDARRLAHAVLEVARSSELRRKLGLNAKNKSKRFSAGRIASQYERILQRVVN